MNTSTLSRRAFVGVAALSTGRSAIMASQELSPDGPERKYSGVVQLNDHVIRHPRSPDDHTTVGFPPSKGDLVTMDNCESTQQKARWMHRHVRDLVPTHVVRRGVDPVCVLAARPADVGSVRIPDGAGGETTVAKWVLQNDADAFMVLRRGNIVHEEYFHGMREEEPHLLWSATKSIAAGVVANLLTEGLIKLDEQVTHYVPEVKGTGYEGATVRHCLDMRSGVAWDNASQGETNTWNRYRRANGFLARKLAGEPLDQGEYHALMTFPDFSKARARAHGGHFEYKDSDNRIVTWACEKVTGTRFADLVSKFIWSKLGCEHDADMLCDGLGSVSDGISVTPRYLARWGQMHLDDGRFAGRQIVPAFFLQDIQHRFDPNAITDQSFRGPKIGIPRSTSYRSWFWIDMHDSGNAFFASGYLGQWFYVLPRCKTVIVKLSTWKVTESWPEYFAKFCRDLRVFRTIAETLDG